MSKFKDQHVESPKYTNITERERDLWSTTRVVNGTRDQDPALAIDDQCSVIVLHIGAKHSGGINADEPKQNQHNLGLPHGLFWGYFLQNNPQGKECTFFFLNQNGGKKKLWGGMICFLHVCLCFTCVWNVSDVALWTDSNGSKSGCPVEVKMWIVKLGREGREGNKMGGEE